MLGRITDAHAWSEEAVLAVAVGRGGLCCAGQPDTYEAQYNFFLGRVRDRLHVCLCFSPVGPQFARRAQQFPGKRPGTAWLHVHNAEVTTQMLGLIGGADYGIASMPSETLPVL